MGYDISIGQLKHDAADEKPSDKIRALYTLKGTVLENVEIIKYLGMTITKSNYLKWNTHIINICTKANRTL